MVQPTQCLEPWLSLLAKILAIILGKAIKILQDFSTSWQETEGNSCVETMQDFGNHPLTTPLNLSVTLKKSKLKLYGCWNQTWQPCVPGQKMRWFVRFHFKGVTSWILHQLGQLMHITISVSVEHDRVQVDCQGMIHVNCTPHAFQTISFHPKIIPPQNHSTPRLFHSKYN